VAGFGWLARQYTQTQHCQEKSRKAFKTECCSWPPLRLTEFDLGQIKKQSEEAGDCHETFLWQSRTRDRL